ncbi:MAG: RdgB/HAM1 family non-canonical purine NTP pyrophosphatase [Gemmatimonadota bacterium]
MDLVVATRSRDKMVEIRRILSDVPGLRVRDLDEAGVPYEAIEEELEPFDTFEDNARSKAEYFHRKTGLPTVADDSGLVVDALDGAPGVYSKRFAPGEGLEGLARDRANNAYLLDRLRGREPGERTARYVCVAVLVGTGDEPLVVRGEAEGRILEAPRGEGGFGYDPLFFDPELDHSFAEISRDEKNARSHRGRAFRALARRLTSGG